MVISVLNSVLNKTPSAVKDGGERHQSALEGLQLAHAQQRDILTYHPFFEYKLRRVARWQPEGYEPQSIQRLQPA